MGKHVAQARRRARSPQQLGLVRRGRQLRRCTQPSTGCDRILAISVTASQTPVYHHNAFIAASCFMHVLFTGIAGLQHITQSTWRPHRSVLTLAEVHLCILIQICGHGPLPLASAASFRSEHAEDVGHHVWMCGLTCQLARPLVAVGRQLCWGAPPLLRAWQVNWRHKILRAAGERQEAWSRACCTACRKCH